MTVLLVHETLLDGLGVINLNAYVEKMLKELPKSPFNMRININMLRHLINMGNIFSDVCIFAFRISINPYKIINQIERINYKNIRLFSISKTNRVGLHNVRVNAML